jgi:hypothetical protein
MKSLRMKQVPSHMPIAFGGLAVLAAFVLSGAFFVRPAHAYVVILDVVGTSTATSSPPATTTPPTGGSSGGTDTGGGQPGSHPHGGPFLFENVVITAGTSSALVTWTTTQPTVSTLSLGPNADGGLGSFAEIDIKTAHAISFDGLDPDTVYYFTIRATSEYGFTNSVVYSFTTKSVAKTPVAPSNVSDFKAVGTTGGNIALSWKNPTDTNFDSVRITVGTRFYPRDPDEGFILYEGSGEGTLDTHAQPGVTYYYSIFVKDIDGNFSSGAVTQYMIPADQSGLTDVPPTSPFFTSTSSPATTVPPFFGGTTTYVGTSTFPSIIFTQNGIALVSDHETVTVKVGVPLVIHVPAALVPADTEEAILQVENSNGTVSFFLLKRLESGSLEVTLPASFRYRLTSDFSIHYLTVGAETVMTGQFITHPGDVKNGTVGQRIGHFAWYYVMSFGCWIWWWIFWFIIYFTIIYTFLRTTFLRSDRR